METQEYSVCLKNLLLPNTILSRLLSSVISRNMTTCIMRLKPMQKDWAVNNIGHSLITRPKAIDLTPA